MQIFYFHVTSSVKTLFLYNTWHEMVYEKSVKPLQFFSWCSFSHLLVFIDKIKNEKIMTIYLYFHMQLHVLIGKS